MTFLDQEKENFIRDIVLVLDCQMQCSPTVGVQGDLVDPFRDKHVNLSLHLLITQGLTHARAWILLQLKFILVIVTFQKCRAH